MERFPKLLDTFDSSVFLLRLVWAGYHGHTARNILKIGAICFAVIVSPIALGICIVAVATYIFTELTYRLCIFSGMVRLRPTER
jgi:ABC-type siderophore export system fused ATPase/permease subunit